MSEAATQQPDLTALKGSMKATWMAGDFGMLAAKMTKPAEQFVNRLPIAGGKRVLDVACGTGNTAIPAARLGAVVSGVDIATNLLEQARSRAVVEGLTAEFDEGDAEALPYPDETFDIAQTMFGAMFAPRPELVAKEMARVLKPGGLVAMGNWNPASFSAAMFKVGSKHVPPPPGIAPPVLWGDEAMVRKRLEPHFESIETEIIRIDFDMPMSAAGAVAFFKMYFGPTKMAFSKLDAAGQAALEADLVALWSGANVADDPEEHVLIHNEYLLVTGRKKQ